MAKVGTRKKRGLKQLFIAPPVRKTNAETTSRSTEKPASTEITPGRVFGKRKAGMI